MSISRSRSARRNTRESVPFAVLLMADSTSSRARSAPCGYCGAPRYAPPLEACPSCGTAYPAPVRMRRRRPSA